MSANKGKRDKRDFVVGRIPVLECLRAKKRKAFKLHVLRNAKGVSDVLDAAGDIPKQEHSRHDLEIMAGTKTHQGLVLEVGPLPVLSFQSLAEREFPRDAIVVLLDGVEDPHNFGAIIRSAAACGALAVVFGKHRSAPVSPTSTKSAAGAMEHIDLVQAANLVQAIDKLKEKGFWVAALEADSAQTIWEADLTGRIAIVIGSEGKGVRPLVLKNCDLQLKIPLTGPITSLNASVSAGIALAECLRQRQK